MSYTNVLYEKFLNPHVQYGPIPMWWWHGEPLTRERLGWQLEQLKAKGVAGVNVSYQHDTEMGTYLGEPELFTKEWWELWKWTVEECERLGMYIGFDDYTLNFPETGMVTKAIVAEDPTLHGRRLEQISTRGMSGETVVLTIPEGKTVLSAVAYEWKDSMIQLPSGILLNHHLQSGELQWTVPSGEWLVIVMYLQTGGLNPMHPEAGARVINHYYKHFESHSPQALSNTLNFFFQDELTFMEGGMPFWSELLEEVFEQKKGYNLRQHLPAIWFDTGELTPKVRLDYYDVAVELMEEGYFKPIYKWFEDRKMTLGCDQASRGKLVQGVRIFGDYFRTMRWFQAPGADDPGNAERRSLVKGKIHSSIAQLYERPRVWLEGYHSSGWGVTPEQLVAFTNENFAFGYNLLDLHGLYYTTYGGWWEWAPPDFHFRQPYWEHMEVFNTYIQRLSSIMCQGKHYCDVAILYPTSTVQAGMFAQEAEETMETIAAYLFEEVIDFDFIDDQSITRASLEEGKLCVAGSAYQAVILPMTSAIRYETLQKLKQFQLSGGVVVAMGCVPTADDVRGRSHPGLREDVETMFFSSKPNGFLIENPFDVQSVHAALEQSIARDVIPSKRGVVVNHRTCGTTDLYFVHNTTKETLNINIWFRQIGAPEKWDAWTGKVMPCSQWEIKDDGTNLTLSLAPREAQLVVFSDKEMESLTSYAAKETEGVRVPLDGDWAFTLYPTMDNQWGDFRLPKTNAKLGAEGRQFRYQDEKLAGVGWTSKDFDDSSWPVYTASFGPQLWQAGPFPADVNLEQLEAELLRLHHVNASTPITIEGQEIYFKEYVFSTQWGIERDPHLQHCLAGPHGLKQAVPDEFIDLGNAGPFPDPSYFVKFEPAEIDEITAPGEYWYMWSTVYAEREECKILKFDAFTYTSIYPVQPQPLLCEAWLNGTKVASAPGEYKIILQAGVNRILYKFQQSKTPVDQLKGKRGFPGKLRLRAHAVLLADSLTQDLEHVEKEDLGLKWWQREGTSRYDIHASDQPIPGCFRLKAPPGFSRMILKSMGKVEAWVDGYEAQVIEIATYQDGMQEYAINVPTQLSTSSQVAIRILQQPGYYAGAAIPEPIIYECSEGKAETGDWSELGLSSYSGTAIYRKTFTVPMEMDEQEAWLHLGQVHACASVHVNGVYAGTKLSPPWKLSLSGLLRPGENTIEIRVSNTLANHYDIGIPSFFVYAGQTKSGLYGPVELEMYNT